MNATVAPPRPIGELAGPAGRRWSGNLGAYESDKLGFLLQARATYGGLVRFDDLTTIVNDPRVAGEILLDREHRYAIRENFRGEVLSEDEIAETRRLRPRLNPGMRRERAVGIVPSVVALLGEALPLAVGKDLDPLPMLEGVSARSIADYYFGADAPAVVDDTRALLAALDGYFGSSFALPASWHTPGRRRILKAHRRLESVIVPLLRARREPVSPAEDLATIVARGLDEEGGPSVRRVAQMIIGSLLAAQRVPAAGAAWMLWEVARDEDLHARVRAEADRRADALPRPRDLPLATAVVLETLRLHPPTWVLHRSLLEDTVIGGYAAPRGHNLLISPYVLHRDEEHFPDPERFDTDRWVAPRPRAAYFFAFGKGPHGCPGHEIALAMLTAILVTALRGYDVVPGTGVVEADPRSTLVPRGLTLRFSRR